jgi:N-acetylglucosaminyl-diphospho-decaprenol L-rhamnosyltransferase
VSCAVLIVGFRAYEPLERCLSSLERFLRPDDEVVVVDHESDEAALGRALARCPRAVGIPRAGNSGFAAGVNLAARHSRAPFLLCLNPDAELLGPVPRVLEEWLVAHPAVGVAGPRVLEADGTVQLSARRFPGVSTLFGGRSTWLTRRFPNNWFTARNVSGRGAIEPLAVDWVAGSCLMTPRDVFVRLGGFDEGFFLYWEDADYCRRAAVAGFRSMYLPAVDVRHAAGRSSAFVKDRAIREFHLSAYRLYWKHSGPLGRAMAPAVHAGLAVRGWLQRRGARRLV